MANVTRHIPERPHSGMRVRHWHVLNVIILLLLLYVVLPQLDYFRHSFLAFRQARLPLLALAVGLTASTYVMAAGLYQLLSKKRLRFVHTLWVRVASGFINRLLPGGIGGISLSLQYLRASGHTLTEASTVVGTNNTVGFLGHVILVLILIATTDAGLRQIHPPHLSSGVTLAISTTVLVLFGLILVVSKLRSLVFSTVTDVFRNLWSYRKSPKRLLIALSLSMLLTITYSAILYVCGRAVGASITFSTAFIVFTVGMVAGTATPTPGGLVGMEAGLIAGFVADDIPASTALVAALLFRLLTYWLPIIPGAFALRVAEKRKYI